jgi:hypothetical protein
MYVRRTCISRACEIFSHVEIIIVSSETATQTKGSSAWLTASGKHIGGFFKLFQ